MSNIKRLVRFYELATEYIEINDLYKGVSIDLSDDTVISVTWRTDDKNRFRSREFPVKDLPGITEKLRKKVQYQKSKNEVEAS